MDENQTEEKLLGSPLDTPELVSGDGPKPFLSTKEFLANTPHHELASIFGTAHAETPKSETPTPSAKMAQEKSEPPTRNLSEGLPSLSEKETPKQETHDAPTKVKKPKRYLLGFFAAFLVFSVIALVALYTWGGMLEEEQPVAPAVQNLGQ